ncbi:MAG TPA: phenylacetate--CoA ligase family protein [Thermodesulfobacteriota bacterium]|nr:phenylacetate--CoA ligase family protein [Thermodesulfobacteriota bacterium]
MRTRKYFEPEIETMSREKLEALQLRRLKLQLKRCYENSEFYSGKFAQAGIQPKDIRSLSDVVHLPFVTKSELRDEQQDYPPLGRYPVAPSQNWAELHPSSGTTGAPVNNLWSFKDVQHISRWTARTMWTFGVRPGDIIQNAFSYGLWVAGMSSHYAARELKCFVIPIGASMTERQIDYLINPGSTVILSTPSYALHIAERLRERRVSPEQIPLRIGCFGGEGGAEVHATREKIEKGLGIEAFDYYGLAEIGPTIASECPEKAGLHWVEDHVLLEIIHPETKKPCEPGEVGVLVMTHLTKEATPMIRYWTNDLAKIDKRRCQCGRTHARSPGGILGRADDMIIYKGAKFYPVQVEKVVRSCCELSDEFCIEITTEPNTGVDVCTIVVECLKEGDITKVTPQIKQGLREECQVTPNIRFVPFGTLERTTFKAKRIIDKRETKRA